MSRQESIYSIALLVFIFWYLIGIVTMLWLLRAQADDPHPIPSWVFYYVITIELIYMVAGIATLVLRYRKSGFARLFTRAYNIFLLFFFPFGTVLGAYGLYALDRKDSEAIGQPTS